MPACDCSLCATNRHTPNSRIEAGNSRLSRRDCADFLSACKSASSTGSDAAARIDCGLGAANRRPARDGWASRFAARQEISNSFLSVRKYTQTTE